MNEFLVLMEGDQVWIRNFCATMLKAYVETFLWSFFFLIMAHTINHSLIQLRDIAACLVRMT